MLFAGISEAAGLIEGQMSGSFVKLSSPTDEAAAQGMAKTGIYVSLFGSETFYLGGGVSYLVQDIRASQHNSLATLEYVVGGRISLTRHKWFWVGADFAPSSTMYSKKGSAETETWTGSSFQGVISVYYPPSDALMMGFSLVYYSGAFSTPSSTAKYSQAVSGLYPNLTLSIGW